MIQHPIPPFFDASSRILILGSFPSPASREIGFYYGHKQNRFWKVLSALYRAEEPLDVAERKALLLRHHVALWDVIASCEITGASDASIRNVAANDLSAILAGAPIKMIFTNGVKAHSLYMKYSMPHTGIKDTALPSTSPANAAFRLEDLIKAWQPLLEYTE